MDLPNILNTKGSVAAAAHQLHPHYAQGNLHVNGSGAVESADGRGIGGMPYGARPGQQLHNLGMASAQRYDQVSQYQQQFPVMSNPYPTPTGSVEGAFPPQPQLDEDSKATNSPESNGQLDGAGQAKAFPCSTCGKGFARRSDLARHERIHSGDRPHVCTHPNCNKQFIQRSALTVHQRVHTGEKPHLCEQCTKPFSDSSSLARHRRIHSGKRPYKCPYADCQKTFTRRTTLTRHQQHHTGTIEESAAAAKAALASRPANPAQRTRSADGTTFSEVDSTRSSPSPIEPQRPISISPSGELPHLPPASRSYPDFGVMNNAYLPPHLRGDMPQSASRSGSTSPSLSSFGGMQQQHQQQHQQQRPLVTSHPNMYPPPPVLEPPTQQEHRNPGSAGGSPHLSSLGWQSPMGTNGMGSNGMGSPVPGDGYMYPDPNYGIPPPPLPAAHHFQQHYNHQNSHLRRPGSTEPDQYDMGKAGRMGELWPVHQ